MTVNLTAAQVYSKMPLLPIFSEGDGIVKDSEMD